MPRGYDPSLSVKRHVDREEAARRLAAGESLRFASHATGYSFGDGSGVERAIVDALLAEKLARWDGSGRIAGTTPEDEARRATEREQQLAQNQANRLARWRDMVHAADDDAALDEALSRIAREAMGLGALTD